MPLEEKKIFKPESHTHNSSIKEKLVKKTYSRINVPNSVKTIIISVQDNSIHHIKMSVNLTFENCTLVTKVNQ